MSYDDELFPHMTPPYSKTWVDKDYCEGCRGVMANKGIPPDGTYYEFSQDGEMHQHYVRILKEEVQ